MQTFIPYADIRLCASVLDYKRLGKQRVEAWQILTAIRQIEDNDTYIIKNGKLRKRAWVEHPCVKMWAKNPEYLSNYARAICEEWVSRGYNDNMLSRFTEYADAKPPTWWGRTDIHDSHKSQLLEKNFQHYSQYFTDIPVGKPYIWGG